MQIRLIFLAIYALSNSVLLAQKPELKSWNIFLESIKFPPFTTNHS